MAEVQWSSRKIPYLTFRCDFDPETVAELIPLAEVIEDYLAVSAFGEGHIIPEAKKQGAADWKDPEEFLGKQNTPPPSGALPTADVRRQQGEQVRPDYELRQDEAWAGDVARDLGLAKDVEFCEDCGYELVFKPAFFNPKTKKRVSDRLVCEFGCKEGRFPRTVWLGD